MQVIHSEYQPLRISCQLPVDPKKSRTSLEKIYNASRKTMVSSTAAQRFPNCNNPAELAEFLFQE